MEDRLREEHAFHERQAEERARVLSACDLRFQDEDYLRHESWIAPALALLGDVSGKRVLDLGCGHGMAAVVLARRGALVTACDLAAGYVHEARGRAAANDVLAQFVVANGEELPFRDACFDGIWGNAVLHHLDLPRAARGLRRVLAPGGRAVFCEPWGGNPLLTWARRCLPYPGKARTRDEKPMGPEDVASLQAVFPSLRSEGHQLLGMVGRVSSLGKCRLLEAVDRRLTNHFPHLQQYCRYMIFYVQK